MYIKQFQVINLYRKDKYVRQIGRTIFIWNYICNKTFQKYHITDTNSIIKALG